jgi:hypothetical protein
MCLFAKRVERDRFIWPWPADGTVAPAQLGYLLRRRALLILLLAYDGWRRTRVVGAFPDGQSALNLAAARRSTKKYLNIELIRHQ